MWRYHRWDSFTCAKMKEGIVVGCLLKVVAMASDDEGFTLSVTSKLREFMALGYPSHVLNGAIGRAFARTRDLLHANREPPPSQSGQGAKTGISASRVGTDGTGAGVQTV